MKRSLAVVLSFILTISAVGAINAAQAWETKVDASVLDGAALGPTDFIVYLEARADLGPAQNLEAKLAKGWFVYKALTETASQSQAPVVAELEQAGAPYRQFWITNAILTRGDAALVQALASRPDVNAIFAVGRGELQLPVEATADTTSTSAVEAVEPSIAHVRADDAWGLGYRGQGVVVAGADTGVRWTHSAIKRQYRGFDAASGTASHDYNWRNAAGPNAACPADDAQPCDDHDHGTHTVGTIVGDDGGANQIGLAPDAEWIACRNMNQGFGAVPTYMDCMQWFIAPTDLEGNNPNPARAPDVVNNSWGCVEACAPPLLKDMIDASRAAGIFYVVSAGNDNQFFLGLTMACNTINFPLAVYQSAFTVGATGATSDEIAYFSSLGPVASNPSEGLNYRKPDIVAPGDGIRSATSAGDDSYASLSGTSMAGPHVAGLVALVISANPALRGDVNALEDVIEQTAEPLTSDLGCGGDASAQVPNNVYGWGRIDALAAVELAASMVERPEPDLVVSDITVDRDRPRASEPVTISATVENRGAGAAEASSTLFAIDGLDHLGSAETPALAAGGSTLVSVEWDTRGHNGEHVLRVTADGGEALAEEREDNNWATRNITVRGNRVENGSFEQPAPEGDAPAAWQGEPTGAGQTSWSEEASDGRRAVTISGTGKSVALHGMPSWSSAPISVSAGERLILTADVHSIRLSSAPTVSLAYLDAAGGLLQTVSALSAPLASDGFVALEQTLEVPAGVSQLRIVLHGFAATDLATSGTVAFDGIGLYEE